MVSNFPTFTVDQQKKCFDVMMKAMNQFKKELSSAKKNSAELSGDASQLISSTNEHVATAANKHVATTADTTSSTFTPSHVCNHVPMTPLADIHSDDAAAGHAVVKPLGVHINSGNAITFDLRSDFIPSVRGGSGGEWTKFGIQLGDNDFSVSKFFAEVKEVHGTGLLVEVGDVLTHINGKPVPIEEFERLITEEGLEFSEVSYTKYILDFIEQEKIKEKERSVDVASITLTFTRHYNQRMCAFCID